MLDISLLPTPTDHLSTTMTHPSFERLRTGNPAARSLPLLQQIALQLAGCVYVDFLNNLQLRIEHHPCLA